MPETRSLSGSRDIHPCSHLISLSILLTTSPLKMVPLSYNLVSTPHGSWAEQGCILVDYSLSTQFHPHEMCNVRNVSCWLWIYYLVFPLRVPKINLVIISSVLGIFPSTVIYFFPLFISKLLSRKFEFISHHTHS